MSFLPPHIRNSFEYWAALTELVYWAQKKIVITKWNEMAQGEGPDKLNITEIKSEPLPGKHCGQGKGRRRGKETNVSFTGESRNEWQLRSNVTSHERDTSQWGFNKMKSPIPLTCDRHVPSGIP